MHFNVGLKLSQLITMEDFYMLGKAPDTLTSNNHRVYTAIYSIMILQYFEEGSF